MNLADTPHIETTQDDESKEFFDVLDTLIENRWMIAIVAALFLLAGISYALLSRPVYQAQIMVQVEDSPDTSAAKSLLGDVSSLFDVKSSAAAETQIIASELVVSRTVDKLKLYIRAEPNRFPIIGDFVSRYVDGISTPGLFGLGGFAWGEESVDVPVFNVPKRMEGKSFKLTILPSGRFSLDAWALDHRLQGAVGSLQRFQTSQGIFEIRIAHVAANPGTTFRLIRNSPLQASADLQDQLDVQEKVKQSEVVIATLRDTDRILASRTLNEIGTQYIKQNIDRKSAEAAQSLEFLNSQLPQLKGQLREAEAKLTKLRDERRTVDLTEEGKLALAQSADAKTRLLELQEKRHELASRFADTHPSVVALDSQITALSSYQKDAESQLRKLPDIQQDLVRLMLDVKVDTDLYTALLGNMQQLELVRAGKVGNVRLVDTASIPEIPVSPKKPLIIVAGFIFGILAGCGAAIGRSMLFRGMTDPTDVERRLSLPVHAIVPLSQQQKRLSHRTRRSEENTEALLCIAFPNDPAIESLRSLRTATQFSMLDAKNNVILIAGPAPGVGKSFIASNFAAVLALSGQRVMLIDGDIRKGRLSDVFGVKRDRGLTDVIVGSVDPSEAIHRNVVEGLDLITTGTLPPNPSELLLNKGLPRFIERLSNEYDIVLIDSPPVLAVADTTTLAVLAGTVLLVAHSGSTKLGEVAESRKRLIQNGIRLNGVIFNGVNPQLGRYGYGSRYGSYRYVAYEYASK
ncbi:polysaccharide biosynthesis tyrosine autokinase [Paraburkholderia aromaticivorans]|jgi:tyrosine-protein kinase Etk/Wzc|uniref:polysaccharide biosynthesis tyrosine autokinase n=1 Tax=Paraburkholderia aromaticivorans TaxID=2026199 RepID=UPI0038BD24E2